MGSIKRFNIERLKKDFGCDYFFETGTWKGDGVAFAQRFGFKKIYSTEIVPEIAERAKLRFKNDSSVEILTGNSTEMMRATISTIPGNCIFWLDAHFPGAEEGLEQYNAYNDETVKLPLEQEVLVIKELRAGFKDVILIDDLRIYEEGPFDSGNLPDNILPPKVRNTEFVTIHLGKTNTVLKSFRDEGYLMVVDTDLYTRSLSNRSLLDRITDKIKGRIL
jgi:hypothetical protein